MTEPLIVKIEHSLVLNHGDYLIVTVDETGRARYKHLPAALAAVIQRDVPRKTARKHALGPVLRGPKRAEFITKLLATLAVPMPFAMIQKKLPDYRSGQLYSTLAQLMKAGRVEKSGDRYVAKKEVR